MGTLLENIKRDKYGSEFKNRSVYKKLTMASKRKPMSLEDPKIEEEEH